MTQILAYQCDQGIVLAADSRAIDLSDRGRPLEVKKLFPLAPHVILVSGGAGYGLLLCRRFHSHIQRSGLWHLEDILDLAPPFLRSEIQRVRHESITVVDHPELERLYFVIAGCVLEGDAPAFRFALLASDAPSDPLHVVETGPVLAVPRQMLFEYRLNHLHARGGGLEEAEKLLQGFLSKLADAGEEVGPPFHFIRISADGLRVRTQAG